MDKNNVFPPNEATNFSVRKNNINHGANPELRSISKHKDSLAKKKGFAPKVRQTLVGNEQKSEKNPKINEEKELEQKVEEAIEYLESLLRKYEENKNGEKTTLILDEIFDFISLVETRFDNERKLANEKFSSISWKIINDPKWKESKRELKNIIDFKEFKKLSYVLNTSCTIGRKSKESYSYVELDSGDTTVSRTHAQLIRRDNQWFFIDNNSTFGSFINDQRITGETEIINGSVFRLGKNTEIKFIINDDNTLSLGVRKIDTEKKELPQPA